MRKLSFFGALILTGGVAMAQNTATTSLTGDDNVSDITQTGVGHSAEITVFGDDNGAGDAISISQSAGDNNTGTIKLGSASDAANANDADIDQMGSGNTASIVMDYYGDGSVAAEGNDIDVVQTGDNNKASVNPLKGADNTVLIDQEGNSSWHIVQTFGSDNDVNIYADGNGNRGAWKILQGSNDNSVDVDQLGDGNHASGQIKKGDFNQVTVLQSGNDNFINSDVNNWQTPGATIIEGDWNVMSLTQTGDDNVYNVSQSGDYHTATLSVLGDGNEFSSTQSGNDGGLLADGNEIDLLVDGDMNEGVLSQDGTANKGDIDIIGDMNTANLSQTGAGNMSTQSITGSGNTSNVIQSN